MQKLRRLNFFDRDVVRQDGFDVHPGVQRLTVACACGGARHLWLGERSGEVHKVDRQYELSAPLQLFDRELLDLKFCEERLLLVGLGCDSVPGAPAVAAVSSSAPAGSRHFYKVVDARAEDREPVVLLVHRVSPSPRGPEYRATSLAISASLQLLAIGAESGAVLLFRGRDLAQEKPSPQVLVADGEPPVTGVHFLEQQHGSGRRTTLFVCTMASVRSWAVQMRGPDGEVLAGDSAGGSDLRQLHTDSAGGSGEGCACIFPTTNALLVAKGDAIFAYDPDEGNMSAMPLEGEKLLISRFKSYFVALTSEGGGVGSAANSGLGGGLGSAGVARPHAVASSTTPSGMPRQNVIVCLAYPHMRFIAYSSQFTDVTHVVAALGSIFVVSRGGADGNTVLFELREKELQEQLDVLVKKRMFEWAAEVGLRAGAPTETICDIYRQHGDALFEKRAYDQALAVYMKTVDLGLPLEPSYIVECYLDAQRIGHVAKYLKRLHERNMAEREHTALLLKCYTKLRDVSTLEDFLECTPVSQYDPAIAIEVLETASYHGLAASVALKVKQHSDYVRITLEHFKKYTEVIDFLRKLKPSDAGQLLLAYGRVLVANASAETVDLVRDLCGLVREGEVAVRADPRDGGYLPVNDFLPIFVDDMELLEQFLRSILLATPGGNSLHADAERLFPTLLELLVRSHSRLGESDDPGSARRDELSRDIMRLIRQHSSEDAAASALVLCQTYGFVEGFFHAAEQLGRYQLMMNWCFERHDAKRLLQVCKKCGPMDQSLWVQALSFLASDDSADHMDEIGEVLRHVADSDLMPLLMVIETLQKSQQLKIGAARTYLQRQFKQLVDSVETSRERTRQDRQEILRMQQEITVLRTQAQVFQNTKCFQCGLTLEVPAVHFFCGHSYHSYCTPADGKCPKCSSEALPKITLREQREAQARNTDDFFKYLRGGAGENGIQAIGEWCKFGAFDATNSAGRVEHDDA